MKDEFGPIKAKSFIDSGPVLEKAWARQCGLGWTGKNTLLINPHTGSFHFIAIILTDLLIEPDFPELDHCIIVAHVLMPVRQEPLKRHMSYIRQNVLRILPLKTNQECLMS